MFDDQDKTLTNNSQGKVEDMFDGVDTPPTNLPIAPADQSDPLVLQEPVPVSTEMTQPLPEPAVEPSSAPKAVISSPPVDILQEPSVYHEGRAKHIVIILFISLIAIAVIVGAVYFALTYLAKSKSDTSVPIEQPEEVSPPINTPVTPPVIVPPALPPSALIDSDNDGLTNDEEDRLGTDAGITDTDADGLSDKDEVRVYSTDPLNQDTDGDTFIDGVEVTNGYNPAGTGRLFNPLPPRNEPK